MKFSVIMPAYNVEKYVSQAIESVIFQDVDDFELIVVDDCSTDGTKDIIKQYAAGYSCVKPIFLDVNSSILQARKKGVAQATGDYILFLDSDDYFEPNCLSAVKRELGSDPVDILHFPTRVVDPNGTEVTGREALKKLVSPFTAERLETDSLILDLLTFDSEKHTQSMWGKAYKTELLKKVFGAAEDIYMNIAEDVYTSCIIYYYARTYRGIGGNALMNYRADVGISLAAATIENVFNQILLKEEAVDEMERFLHSQGAFDKFQQCCTYFSRHFLVQGVDCWLSPRADEMRALMSRRLIDSFGFIKVVREFKGRGKLIDIASFIFDGSYTTIQTEQLAAELFSGSTPEKLLVSLENLDHDGILKLLDAMPSTACKRKKTKTILIDYPKMNIGGLEKVLQIQSDALTGLGYKVIRVYNTKNDLEYPVGENIKLVHIPGSRTDESYWREIIDVIRENEVDLYWNHSMYDRGIVSKLIMAKMIGVKSFVTLHSFSLRFLKDNNAMFYILSRCLKYYDRTVVLDETSQMFWNAFGAKTYYLPNPNPFAPVSEPRAAQGSPFRILWCAHLQLNTKMYMDLPEICYHLKQAGISHELTVLGSPVPNEPTAIDDINAKAEMLGVQDCIKIANETLDVEKYYSESDCFILTSSIEGSPLVLAEASAFALPIVMYDLPYLALVRTGKGIITVPFRDTEAMAAKIAMLAQDAAAYGKASANVLENIRDFSREYPQERLLRACIEDVDENIALKEHFPDADSTIVFRELTKLQYMALQQYLAQLQKTGSLEQKVNSLEQKVDNLDAMHAQRVQEIAERDAEITLLQKKINDLNRVIDDAYIITNERIQKLSAAYKKRIASLKAEGIKHSKEIANLKAENIKRGREIRRLKKSRSYRYARFIRRQARRVKHPIRTLKNFCRRFGKK